MPTHLTQRLALLCAASALVTSACSSSEATDQATNPPTSPESSGQPSSAPTGAPLVIGVISGDSGPAGSSNDMPETARRWSEYVNARGGVNGHPVKIVLKDDQFNASKALQAAKDLVENEKAVVIADNSFVNTAFAKYASEKNVPVVGLASGAETFPYVTDPNFFAPTNNILTSLWGTTKVPVLLGKKKHGFGYCAEIAACGQAVPLVEQFAKSNGAALVYSAAFSATAPNYTAQCLAARTKGVDALQAGGTVPAANQRFYEDCNRQGYRPLPIYSLNISNSALKSSALPELVGTTAVLPWFLKQGAGSEAFHTAMDPYLDDATSPATVAVQWAGLQFIAKAMSRVGSTPTSADFVTGVYALKDETLDGLTAPLNFTKGKPGSTSCLFGFKAVKGELSALEEGKPICQSPAAS